MWAKWADELPRHPKILAAAAKLGRSNNVLLALGFFGCGLSYASENLTDGFLADLAVEGFPARNPHAFAQAMVEAGLWEKAKGGYQIHDYHHYNPSAAKVREKRAKDLASKRQRFGADSAGNLGGLANDSTTNRDRKISARGRARTPDPVPVPVPVPGRTGSR